MGYLIRLSNLIAVDSAMFYQDQPRLLESEDQSKRFGRPSIVNFFFRVFTYTRYICNDTVVHGLINCRVVNIYKQNVT